MPMRPDRSDVDADLAVLLQVDGQEGDLPQAQDHVEEELSYVGTA